MLIVMCCMLAFCGVLQLDSLRADPKDSTEPKSTPEYKYVLVEKSGIDAVEKKMNALAKEGYSIIFCETKIANLGNPAADDWPNPHVYITARKDKK